MSSSLADLRPPHPSVAPRPISEWFRGEYGVRGQLVSYLHEYWIMYGGSAVEFLQFDRCVLQKEDSCGHTGDGEWLKKGSLNGGFRIAL